MTEAELLARAQKRFRAHADRGPRAHRRSRRSGAAHAARPGPAPARRRDLLHRGRARHAAQVARLDARRHDHRRSAIAHVHPDARTVLDVVARRFPRVATCLLPVPGTLGAITKARPSSMRSLRDDAQGRLRESLRRQDLTARAIDDPSRAATAIASPALSRYVELRRRAQRDRARLRYRAALPLDQGDTIALWSTNRPEFLWIWLGGGVGGLTTPRCSTRASGRIDDRVPAGSLTQAPRGLRAGCAWRLSRTSRVTSRCCVRASWQDAPMPSAPISPALRAHSCRRCPCPRPVRACIRWSVKEPSQGNALPGCHRRPRRPPRSSTRPVPRFRPADRVQLTRYCVWRRGVRSRQPLRPDPGRSPRPVARRSSPCSPTSTACSRSVARLERVLEERFDAATMLRDLQQEACTATYLLLMVEQLVGHPDFARADLEAAYRHRRRATR